MTTIPRQYRHDPPRNPRVPTSWVALLYIPAFANDLFFIFTTTALEWLVADYATSFLMLAVVLAIPVLRADVIASIPLKRGLYESRILMGLRLAAAVWGSVFILMLIEYFVHIPLQRALPQYYLFAYPKLDSPWLYWLDLTFGLVLSAVSQELSFRCIARSVLKIYFKKDSAIILLSALVFGLAHWSHGIANISANVLSGIVFMILFIHSGSILLPTAAHYLILLWHSYSWYNF